jgi:hypothetical protein
MIQMREREIYRVRQVTKTFVAPEKNDEVQSILSEINDIKVNTYDESLSYFYEERLKNKIFMEQLEIRHNAMYAARANILLRNK